MIERGKTMATQNKVFKEVTVDSIAADFLKEKQKKSKKLLPKHEEVVEIKTTKIFNLTSDQIEKIVSDYLELKDASFEWDTLHLNCSISASNKITKRK